MAEYIDKQQLKKHYSWWNNDNQRLFDQIVDIIPLADVRPVEHGHWTWEEGVFVYGINRDALGSYRCTACENCSPRMTNYCPICGARMDE